MLPPAEEDLALREPDLPGLALLLDRQRLAAALGAASLGEPYLRLKPGTKCVLSARTGEGPFDAVLAIAEPPGRHAGRRKRPKLGDAAGVTWLGAESVTILPLHLDRDIPGLRRLHDPSRRRGLLREVGAPPKSRLRLLRHNPGRRVVLRLDAKAGPVAVLRAVTAADFARVLEGARLGAALGGAGLLGQSEAHAIVVSTWVEGRPLWSESRGLGPREAVRATGAEIARIHAAGGRLAGLRALDPAEEEGETLGAVTAAADLLPAIGPRARDLADRARAALAEGGRRVAPIHGDFTADQVVIGPGGPVLIDWDRVGAGDPARDLGTFLARLDAQAIDGDLGREEAAGAARALLSGYGAPPPGVAAQHARALLGLLAEGFRRRQPDWPERMSAILDRVEAVLGAAPAADDPLAPLLARALDPAATAPHLAARGVEVVRRKPGRRALLRFATPAGAALGKIRAKGPDRRTPALHAALRAAGLDGSSGVGVPRVLGEAPDLHLWLQEEVPGRRVADLLRPGADAAAAHRAGAALARLHAAPVPASRRWSLADEADVLSRSLAAAGQARADLLPRLDALSRAGAAVLASLGEGRTVGLHRDWHPDQALVEANGTVWILDLDLHATGDAAIDVGNFLAHVAELSLRRHGDAAALADHEAAFLAGYAAEGGAVDPARVEALRALSLARLVAVAGGIPDRRVALPRLLDLAEAAVGRAARALPGDQAAA